MPWTSTKRPPPPGKQQRGLLRPVGAKILVRFDLVLELATRVRHGVEAVDHDVALGFIDTYGHVEPPVVKFLVEDFRIAVQPADAGTVGGVDRQVQRHARGRQPIFDRGE